MTAQENNVTQIEAPHESATSELEDLQVQEVEAAEIKGGPIYIKYGDIKGEVQ